VQVCHISDKKNFDLTTVRMLLNACDYVPHPHIVWSATQHLYPFHQAESCAIKFLSISVGTKFLSLLGDRLYNLHAPASLGNIYIYIYLYINCVVEVQSINNK
jgi:hypothetical protein